MAKASPTKKTTSAKPQDATESDGDKQAQIDGLLKQLKAETIASKKKAIRRSLRSLGHKGGPGTAS